ncbi:MAG: YfiR family protein [Pirellulales bacterium]|nr:YfiR family protein [Pirellulales bacterium]
MRHSPHHTPSRNASSDLPPTIVGLRHWSGAVVFLAAGLSLVFIVLGATALVAQEEEIMAASREYRIKAAYLYQFGRYVEWPATAFATPQSPFVIGVLDNDPVAADLEQIAQIKKIQDRPIKVKRFSSPDDIEACHILYLSDLLPAETQTKILSRMSRRGVLPVGESSEFLDWGGAIRLARVGNNIRVYIARKAAEREGLAVSAKLLQVANVVD